MSVYYTGNIYIDKYKYADNVASVLYRNVTPLKYPVCSTLCTVHCSVYCILKEVIRQ